MLINDRITLLQLVESFKAIESYLEGYESYEIWVKDRKTVDACLMQVIYIGEMVNKLSSGFMLEYDEIEWFKIRGLRNIIAHDYLGIDYEEIWNILTDQVPLLNTFVSTVL
jgi:uncharacterized protein with HEPN domain